MLAQILASATLTLGLSPAAAAAEGWTAPRTIAGPFATMGQQVIDRQGTASMTLLAGDGAFLARAARGQAFGAPTELRAPGSTQLPPRLAVDERGVVRIAWRTSEGVFATDGGTAGERLAPFDRRQLPVVAAAAGVGAVAWRQYADGVYSIHAALTLAGGGYGTPRTIARDPRAKHDPAVVVTPAGQVVVAWSSPQNPIAVVRGDRGGFAAEETASPAWDQGRLAALTSDADGGITVLWTAFGPQGAALRAAYAAPGAGFGPPSDVAPAADAVPASIASSPSGVLLARRADGDTIAVTELARGTVVRRSTITARPAELGPTAPNVAAGAAGDGGAVVAWVERGGALAAARRAPGEETFGRPQGIVSTDEIHELRALAAPGGELRVIWARTAPEPSSGDELRSSSYSTTGAPVGGDRTAPRLRVRLARGQRLSGTARAVVRVRASERATLRATARVRAGRTQVSLRGARRSLRARRWTTVRLRVPATARRAIRRAARQDLAVRLRVTLTARDRAGNVRRVTRTAAAR